MLAEQLLYFNFALARAAIFLPPPQSNGRRHTLLNRMGDYQLQKILATQHRLA